MHKTPPESSVKLIVSSVPHLHQKSETSMPNPKDSLNQQGGRFEVRPGQEISEEDASRFQKDRQLVLLLIP